MSIRPITRLAVCGWNDDIRDALTALEATGAFRGVAVGHYAASTLVRARTDTADRVDPLPAFRQVPEMLRSIEYDAILVGDADGVAEATTIAATRGSSVILLADSVRGSELESAADAAAVHGVNLSLLQPARHDAGMDDLRQLLSGAADWSPHYLDITVEAPTDVARLVSVAISHLVTLLDPLGTGGQSGLGAGPHTSTLVRGITWGDPARVVNATVIAHGRHTTLHTRHAPDTFVRIAGDAPAGAFELRLDANGAALMVAGLHSSDRATAQTGDQLRYRVEPSDQWTLEAARIADGANDVARARTEGAIRDALERSVATGEEQSTACCRRPSLRLLESTVGETSTGEHTEATRPSEAVRTDRRRLHLVGS